MKHTYEKLMTCIGIVLTGLFSVTAYQHDEGIRQEEAKYMQDHYGYRDNMADYLEYLQDHDIDAYMKLKPIHEDIQRPNYWGWGSLASSWLVIAGALLWIVSKVAEE